MATPPVFSAGAVLTAAQMNAIGMWQITPSSVTNGTLSGGTATIGNAVASCTINGCFNSDFDAYRVHIFGVQASAAGGLGIQIGTITTNVYYGNLNYQLYTGTTLTVESYNGVGQMFIALSASADAALSSSFDLFYPNSTTSKTLHGTYYGRGYTGQFGCLVLSSTAQTSLKIFNSSGTLTGGTVRIYGYRK